MPYLRFGVTVISLFLPARLLEGVTLAEVGAKAVPITMPYQRGQFWVRRFQRQAAALCAALAIVCAPSPAANFICQALYMLESIGWIAPHRFLFADLRFHAGLAGVSRSGREGRRAPTDCPVRLRAHTQLLHGVTDVAGLMLLAQEMIRMDTKAQKIALFGYELLTLLCLIVTADPISAIDNVRKERSTVEHFEPLATNCA